jgi:hypothetical protein
MNNNRLILAVFASSLLLSVGANAAEKLRVMITPSLASVEVLHEG